MKLRTKFFIFAFLIHSILVTMSLLLLNQSKIIFIAAEVMILLSLIVTVNLYRAFLRPLNMLAAGIESIKDKDFSTTFVKTGQNDLDMLINVYNRMIEQLRDERIKQQEQHYFLERLIKATPIGVIILDLDGNITMVNPTALEILGAGEAETVGYSLDHLKNVPGKEIKEMKAGESRIINVNGIQTYKCRKSHFLDRGFYHNFILIEELTREILNSQKRAYEKVIRMMSHEINNSVGAVNSILDSSLHYRNQLIPEDHEDFEHAIRVAIERNSGLNKFMANFADVVRIPPPAKSEYDLNRLLQSVEVLMSAECKRREIEWVWELGHSSMIVDIDVQQMEQVFVNIVKNAIEAIDNHGSITIRTSKKPDKLRIIDTGRGITLQQRSHLFTPFYSTKSSGQGIGLTLIREILINHGFRFNLESPAPGHTEFWIDFADQAPTI